MAELHLSLIGFMGSGKTTVGQLMAQRLGRPFVDTDAMVEEKLALAMPKQAAAQPPADGAALQAQAAAGIDAAAAQTEAAQKEAAAHAAAAAAAAEEAAKKAGTFKVALWSHI